MGAKKCREIFEIRKKMNRLFIGTVVFQREMVLDNTSKLGTQKCKK
jgi:hypothetical protein